MSQSKVLVYLAFEHFYMQVVQVSNAMERKIVA